MSVSKKKIAIVSDAVYPFNKGGKERRIYDITTRLAAEGHSVTLYCMQWWKGERILMKDGVVFHAISPLYPLYAGNRRSIKEAIFFALHCLKLVREDFDAIEADHMPHLVLFTLKIVCVIKRRKLIATWHEVWGLAYWREYLGTIAGTIAYLVEMLSVRLPDTIVSVSDHTTKNLRAVLGASGTIVTIPNGLDVAKIAACKPAEKGADVLFVGRLLSHKNVDMLLRAMAIIIASRPDASLWIIGDGPERASLESLSKELGIDGNVVFPGILKDQDELYRIMHASGVLALPSTREGFGIVVLEANACGMPVVTIDHEQNAAKELITDGENGIMIALGENELAKAIGTLLGGRKRRETYMSYAEKHDWKRVAAEIERIYTS